MYFVVLTKISAKNVIDQVAYRNTYLSENSFFPFEKAPAIK